MVCILDSMSAFVRGPYRGITLIARVSKSSGGGTLLISRTSIPMSKDNSQIIPI